MPGQANTDFRQDNGRSQVRGTFYYEVSSVNIYYIQNSTIHWEYILKYSGVLRFLKFKLK